MNQAQSGNPAKIYEDYFVPAMFIPWAGVLLRHAAPAPAESLLDVACGTGIVSRMAAPMVGAEGLLVGLDMSPAMLAVAKSLPPPGGAGIRWQEGNALALPFLAGAFDLVLCQHGLPFFPDRAGAVKEMHRVLKPGGRAAVMVLQALDRHPVFRRLMESVAAHLSLPMAEVAIPFALWDGLELGSLFSQAGFTKVNIIQESITARFPDPKRFVAFAVSSSAAAVPAFNHLDEPDRIELLEKIKEDVERTIQDHRELDDVVFPMFAHLALATT